MAEVYHIYSIFDMPPSYIALLTNGLGDESRTRKKIEDRKLTKEVFLLAGIQDSLNLLVYFMLDPKKRGKPPESVLASLLGEEPEEKEQLYENPSDFREAWKSIVGKNNG